MNVVCESDEWSL